MDFEWDERKRLANIEKHGLDFIDAIELFETSHLTGPARTVAEEDRFLAVGLIGDVHVAAIFTHRGDTIRLISLRRARNAERQRYHEVFGH
ncbi:MAG TPA: BrnT family toxin [Acidiphilium sp.]